MVGTLVVKGLILAFCHIVRNAFSLLIYLIYRYPDQQKSKEIFLDVAKSYYLEGLFVAQGGGDHIEIGVYLPEDPVYYQLRHIIFQRMQIKNFKCC